MPAPTGGPRRRRAPRRLIGAGLGLLAAAITAFVLLGNGAADPIAQAATVSANAPGYRLTMGFTITSPQMATPISASASAVVDTPDHAVAMSLVMQAPDAGQSAGTSTLRLAMILEGQNAYVKLPQALAGQVPKLGGRPWIEFNEAKAFGLPALSTLGESPNSDPTAILQELRAGADSITDEGQQLIDGVQTTHYHAEISLDRALSKSDLPSSLRTFVQKLIQSQRIPVDVWVDAHHLVRRINMFLAISVGGGPSLQESTTTDFSDYGPQPRPTPPPADQVTDGNNLAGSSTIAG